MRVILTTATTPWWRVIMAGWFYLLLLLGLHCSSSQTNTAPTAFLPLAAPEHTGNVAPVQRELLSKIKIELEDGNEGYRLHFEPHILMVGKKRPQGARGGARRDGGMIT